MEELIKNNLLKIRLTLGYKYAKEFAEFLEISPNQYGRYESNKEQPSAENILKICQKLNMRIEEIIVKDDLQ